MEIANNMPNTDCDDITQKRLFDIGIFVKIEDTIYLSKSLRDYLDAFDLTVKNGQLKSKSIKKIRDALDSYLFAMLSEAFLHYMCRKFTWIKDEINYSGFDIDAKENSFPVFLARTGQSSIEYLSTIFKTSDLLSLLPAGVAKNATKENLINMVINNWLEERSDQ